MFYQSFLVGMLLQLAVNQNNSPQYYIYASFSEYIFRTAFIGMYLPTWLILYNKLTLSKVILWKLLMTHTDNIFDVNFYNNFNFYPYHLNILYTLIILFSKTYVDSITNRVIEERCESDNVDDNHESNNDDDNDDDVDYTWGFKNEDIEFSPSEFN